VEANKPMKTTLMWTGFSILIAYTLLVSAAGIFIR
jgi:hypothetical protein